MANNMFIFSATSVLSVLLFALSGMYSLPIGAMARPILAPIQDPVWIQTTEHEQDECAPRLQAEQNNTHDIACLLESVQSIISDQIKSNPSLQCNPSVRIFYGDSFPALYRAVFEIVSTLDQAELAVQNLNESMCALKKLVATGLNTTVRNHCGCSGSQDCASNAVPSVIGNDGTNRDETCLLLNLQTILRMIQSTLGGDSVTCRRASNVQQQILVNFEDSIYSYHGVVATPEIRSTIRLPPSPCLYKGSDLSMHIKSLHTLAPYLGNLTSCEAQEISRNISEVVFPVIRQLLGEVYIEQLVNNSVPFSTRQETSLGSLNEQGMTICLVQRLNTIYRRFMDILRQTNVDIISEQCVQDSH